MTKNLLNIQDLRVTFSTRNGPVESLRGISLSVEPGETLGIVGESGSGKSVTALSILQLLGMAGKIAGGRIIFNGDEITSLPSRSMRSLRGSDISMVFQNPRAALNPIRPIGFQIADVLRAHRQMSRSQARERALELLKSVQIRDPERRLSAYPHELSGGMCQRVMIAMAIACEPALLIADEPTTGLDATTQKTVMDLLSQLTHERSMALILITHDLGLAAQYCRRIAVMERGKIVETAHATDLFHKPCNPYTRRLVAATPTPFSRVSDLISQDAELTKASPPLPGTSTVRPFTSSDERTDDSPPLLDVQYLSKRYHGDVAAVDEVSFQLFAGESLGLVGESGSGKTTLSRLICRLIDPTSGTILFDGQPIGAISERNFYRSPLRKDIQIVFQDPGESLNPRFTIFDSIAEPIRRLVKIRESNALEERVRDCAQRVGLPAELLGRFPHQLSGGQKARVGIARAIAVSPRLLVLDEPTAALDVSVQAVILELLDRLRRENGMAYLFVSHDLNVVRMMCNRTIVLRSGSVVEEGISRELFEKPRTEYTRKLIAAIPLVPVGGGSAS
jgi:peptide/nickel transport system ATP-binding protein